MTQYYWNSSTQGLLDQWKKQLLHPIDSFEDGVEQARLAEAVDGQDGRWGVTAGNHCNKSISLRIWAVAKRNAKTITCFYCHKKGHLASECRSSLSGKNANVKCFRCQQRGHYATGCLSASTGSIY